MLWMNWGPGSTPAPPRPDMAYSVEDDTYLALYAVWRDAARDDANLAWATDSMRAMEDLASGIQLADENLGRRPARFLTAENLRRVDEIRARHDPEGRVHRMDEPAAGLEPGPRRRRMNGDPLEPYLSRPMAPPAGELLEAIETARWSAQQRLRWAMSSASWIPGRCPAKQVGARSATVAATWPCGPPCPASAERWSTGGSIGIRGRRSATGSGTPGPPRELRGAALEPGAASALGHDPSPRRGRRHGHRPRTDRVPAAERHGLHRRLPLRSTCGEHRLRLRGR